MTRRLESRLQPELRRWSFGRLKAELQRRAGATLTEVLMSILIMAVGIVSVFTLFPISVLRTIKATQETNSKIHKLNAVEVVQTSPGFLTTFALNTTIGASGPLTYQGQWQPQKLYAIDDIVVPTLRPGQSAPSPLVLYAATVAGASGADEPVWTPQANVVDGAVTWVPILDPATIGTTNIPVSYVIDPLGFNLNLNDGTTFLPDMTTPSPDRFGNKTDVTTGVGVTPIVGGLLRIHGGLTSTAAAAANVTHPDSWEEVLSATAASATTGSVTYPPTVDLTGAGGPIRRMVLTSIDGQMTVYRPILNIAGQTVNLAEPIPVRFPLDGSLNPDVGTARIETLSRRYTWFLTVRNSASGDPDIKCVVVFNRNFGSASEHVYDANFSNAGGVDVDNFGGPDGAQHGLTAPNWVKIAWTAAEPKPLLKPGNWLFDARDVTWYRIQQVFSEGTAGGTKYAVLILDRNVRTVTPPAPGPVGRVMLMPGIVEVFNFNL